MALSELQLSYAAFDLWRNSDAGDNLQELRRVRKVIPVLVEECLTDTQRKYVMHHFMDRMSVSDIADMYGVARSTVSRTIHRGMNKLYRYLRVASPMFMNAPQIHEYLKRQRV